MQPKLPRVTRRLLCCGRAASGEDLYCGLDCTVLDLGCDFELYKIGKKSADADVKLLTLYKVCSKSGDIGVADLGCLGNDPWVYMSSGPRGSGGGHGSVLHCYKSQVFVSRKDGLEVWSQLEEQSNGTANMVEQPSGKEKLDREGINENSFRSSYMDTEEDAKRGMILMMEGGGDRLFVVREEIQSVEVWESSCLSGAFSLL